MGWNEPPEENKNKDPWGKKPSNKQGPPNLDELLVKLSKQLSQTFRGGNKKNGASPDGSSTPPNGEVGGSSWLNFILIGFVLMAWVLYLGFFIVQPGEEAAVLRFGKYVGTVKPGPHWILPGLYSQETVNIQQILRTTVAGEMITKEVDIINIELSVQYRINNLQQYLFEVKDPNTSLIQATESAMRQVIATSALDAVLSTIGTDNISLGEKIGTALKEILSSYKTGIEVLGVEILSVQPPEKVKEAFNDAIKAQEDEVRYANEAQAYASKVIPLAKGAAARIVAEARAYKSKVTLDAEGEVARFNAILPEYENAPELTRKRLYISAIEEVLRKNMKIFIDNRNSSNIMYLPLDKMLKGDLDIRGAEPAKTSRIPQEMPDENSASKIQQFSSERAGRT